MIVARSVSELHDAVSGPITFVPTMGALHDGHASLVRLAATGKSAVVVSDFVNPTQFAPGEDFDAYPRDLDADAAIAEAAGADVLWAPAVDEIYPVGFSTIVDPGPLALELCGASRPGHFVGVATVVTRLFGLVRPTRAIFGRKDYQQLIILQRVAHDLALGIDVVGAPTIREADGLAMSSRNRYLSNDERARAAAVPGALQAVAAAYAAGERNPAVLLDVSLRDVEFEYLELRAADLSPYDPEQPAVVLIACRVGSTRLIDNLELDPIAPASASDALHAKESA
ncbi:MAG: pantoate--beta-alanine ligase [Thermoleophilia bacterium]